MCFSPGATVAVTSFQQLHALRFLFRSVYAFALFALGLPNMYHYGIIIVDYSNNNNNNNKYNNNRASARQNLPYGRCDNKG